MSRTRLDAPQRAREAGAIEARCWRLAGRVQGVGFRPFVFRLARSLGVRGEVRNLGGEVEVVGEGEPAALDRLGAALTAAAPPLARPRVVACTRRAPEGHAEFRIAESASSGAPRVHLPPDLACCDDCLRELADPGDRRHRYPFINCTQCGPRYTLIERLPYDRANTTMRGFALCADCRAEYAAPHDRRFHAEPLACPSCGPRLAFRAAAGAAAQADASALAACLEALRAGRIVAVKGVGGYHLLTDARSDAAVARLRARKRRPHKPLAVMLPEHALRQLALDDAAAAALCDRARPIVLAPPTAAAGLAAGVAPGLREVGVMLAYSPLHHLLVEGFGGPLVATSANLAGEPVLTDASEVEARLGTVADAFLHHDRPIARPADDPVCRVIDGRARPIRLGRGTAPVELRLPFRLARPALATGAHLKNTVALGWDDRAVVSPHIGDLGTPRAAAVFEQVAGDLQRLYGVTAEQVFCDAHPGYASTRWARASGLPATAVYHHHAHAAALAAEHPACDGWLVFTWDGVGFGPDGTLWGGEGLFGRPGAWTRVATLRPFRLPGGERAAHEPWRSAAALCWELGLPWRVAASDLAWRAWRQGVNAPQTSAAGRLFDAAAALVGLVETATFEGHGPMWLEALAADAPPQALDLPLSRAAGGTWQLDWAPLVTHLLGDGLAPAQRAALFHGSLARGLLAQARAVRRERAVRRVGLTGGVFQNRLLAEAATALLRADGFEVHLPAELPCNDAGIAFGQLVEAGARQ